MAAARLTGFPPNVEACAPGSHAITSERAIMMARSDVMAWEPGAHASTFGGNPVSLAAAMETLRLIQEKYCANAAKVGAFLKSRLLELKTKHPRIGDVRGL